MRVALAVGEGVMAAVVGHPPDHRALRGQPTGDRHRDPQTTSGLERAMGEIPMVADGHPGARDDVAGGGQRDTL